jgi:hypothetical protein
MFKNRREKKIGLGIYIHETHRERVKGVQKYWPEKTGFPIGNLIKFILKKDKLTGKKKNKEENYRLG